MPLYELFCGLTTSLIVSPVMTLIDSAVIKSQLENKKFTKTLHEITKDYAYNKSNFMRPFGIMYFVYASTYCTANLSQFYCEKYNHNKNISLFSTSIVNICCIVYKDREYTKIFNSSPKIFPKISYGLFALRDTLTIFSTFIIKKDCIHLLDKYMPHNTADLLSSFSLPILCQVISTPIHILSIDFYNNPNSSLKERVKNIRTQYKSICLGRVIRVLPAFCVGGFINDMLRNRNKI